MNVNYSNRFVQAAVLMFIGLIWGSSFILMKRGLVYFDSTEVAAYRLSIAMVVMLPIALRNLSEIRGRWRALVLFGLIGSVVPAFLFALAQTEISSSLSGMLNSLTSLFTLLIGALFFRVRPWGTQVLGVVLALVGALGLIGFVHLLELSTYGRYSLLVVVATACYGIGVNIVKSQLHDVRPHHITALSFLLTVPLLLVYLLVFTDFVPQLASDPASWWGVLYLSLLGIFGTALALVIFNRLIKETTAVFASSVTYLIPVVAVGWGVLDGEAFDLIQLVYLALILCGILLINLPRTWLRARWVGP